MKKIDWLEIAIHIGLGALVGVAVCVAILLPLSFFWPPAWSAAPWAVVGGMASGLALMAFGDDDDEKDTIGITDCIGRGRSTPIINESGLCWPSWRLATMTIATKFENHPAPRRTL
ncbi:hypothetical protein P7F88_25320 [Vibrio hannami]|uniref:hypothetical protein n=1 Tax=Vibrio hannami TaxID=2717094 RepID=UPI00240EB613|nr:hypothetical protein [Vibrio hannami]MDG3089186.1 hypothetical protein [Vibrio hannami]